MEIKHLIPSRPLTPLIFPKTSRRGGQKPIFGGGDRQKTSAAPPGTASCRMTGIQAWEQGWCLCQSRVVRPHLLSLVPLWTPSVPSANPACAAVSSHQRGLSSEYQCEFHKRGLNIAACFPGRPCSSILAAAKAAPYAQRSQPFPKDRQGVVILHLACMPFQMKGLLGRKAGRTGCS